MLDLAVLAVVCDDDGYRYDIVRRLRQAGSTTWVTRRSTAPSADAMEALIDSTGREAA